MRCKLHYIFLKKHWGKFKVGFLLHNKINWSCTFYFKIRVEGCEINCKVLKFRVAGWREKICCEIWNPPLSSWLVYYELAWIKRNRNKLLCKTTPTSPQFISIALDCNCHMRPLSLSNNLQCSLISSLQTSHELHPSSATFDIQ